MLVFPAEPCVTTTASSIDTVTSGFRRTSHNPFTVASPTRKPVNEPGPEMMAKPSRSLGIGLVCLQNFGDGRNQPRGVGAAFERSELQSFETVGIAAAQRDAAVPARGVDGDETA